MNPPSRLANVIDPDDGPFVEALPASPRRRKRQIAVFLLLLTIVGGALRFISLDRPSVWGDEASTFRRVSGTYEQMLKTLERDPFTPLFYSFEWAMKNWAGVHLTPFWLRFLPALAGTLMVPAMYFLARQVASVRTSLVAAMLTCCSAFLINYSRDAKMYMTFWLFVTLCAGSFFWWLRKRTWTAWLCWIAAGCAMMGLNWWGALILAFTPIWLLTARRVHWVMGFGYVIGLLVILTGPVGYSQLFNRYTEQAVDSGGYAGVRWLIERNKGAGGLELVRDSASAFLYNFTFLQERFPPEAPLNPPQPILIAAIVALTAIATLLLLGAMPWRPATTPAPPTAPEPWWRSTLWIAIWLIVPTYLFYCISLKRPMSPYQWWWALDDFTGRRPWLYALAIATAAWLITRWKPAAMGLAVLAIAAALATLGYAFYTAYAVDIAEPHRWYRPIDAIGRWIVLLFERPLLRPLLVFIPAIAIARSAADWPRRFGHVLAAVAIGAAIFFLLYGLHQACAAALLSFRQDGVKTTSIWIPRYLGFMWPALAIVVAALLVRLPTPPLRWTAIAAVLGLNLFVAYHRVMGDTDPPIARVVADVRLGEKDESAVRTYVPPINVKGGPGVGTINSRVGVYYLLHDRDDIEYNPVNFHRIDIARTLRVRQDDNPNVIANNAREPQVNRIIVWKADRDAHRDAGPIPARVKETLLEKLGPEWKLEKEEFIPVRYHWSWATRYQYIRREYVKN